LEDTERASDSPDQVSQIRALLKGVADLERERDESAAQFALDEAIWVAEEEAFQAGRWENDLACRQRLAALLYEVRQRHRERTALQAEISRMERLLLDLENTFSTSRQRLHEYDQELTTMVRDQEMLLVNLQEALAEVREQGQLTDTASVQRAKELECLRRIGELHASKIKHLQEIDSLEQRLDAARSRRRD